MKTILIVEDDQKISLALCVRLKAHGYATRIAGDAVTAVSLAVRHKPDLILLDLSLPAGNGLALAEQFHELPETRGTPVIFATASKDPELRRKAIDLGVVGLLRKPYEAEALLTVVNHALDNGDGTGHDLAVSRPNRSPAKNQRPRILIVQDDDSLGRALAVRMEAAGFETTVAKDALAGVRSAVNTRPDAVVLDISLPAGDGFSVAERIQANIPTPLPIVFLTASQRPEFRQRAQQLGAVGFFEKPYEADALVATLRQALI